MQDGNSMNHIKHGCRVAWKSFFSQSITQTTCLWPLCFVS